MRSLLRKIRVLFYVYKSINKWWAKVEPVISKLEEKGYPVEKMIGLAIYDSEDGGTVLALPCWVERIVNNYSMNVGIDLDCTKSLSQEVREIWDKESQSTSGLGNDEKPAMDKGMDDYIDYPELEDPYYYHGYDYESGVVKGEEFTINEEEAVFRRPRDYAELLLRG